MRCTIIPPYLLSRIAALEGEDLRPAARAAEHALRDIQPLQRLRRLTPELPTPPRGPEPALPAGDQQLPPPGPHRTIADAGNAETLPGRTVRAEDQPPTDDQAVSDAYDHLGHTYAFFAAAYRRDSIDDRGMDLNATVHYGKQYENAFWNGARMVFGDGDGIIFNSFTASLTVIAHELTHGLTQFTTNLVYENQAGALHESISDVFGALTQQHHLQQKVSQASW